MTDEQKNEEAHGLWELAVARLAAATEVVTHSEASPALLVPFVEAEREAFAHWHDVSKRVTR